MGFFNDLEKRIERMIETSILGGFTGKIRAEEVARELWLEMTAHKQGQKKRTFVPNYFELTIAPTDMENIREDLPDIEVDILRHLEQESLHRDFSFHGPLAVDWIEDPEIKPSFFKIAVSFTPVEELPEHIRSKIAKFRNTAESAATLRERIPQEKNLEETLVVPLVRYEVEETLTRDLTSVLSVVDGFDKGKVFQVIDEEYFIGRSDECGICIGDPTISRRHARIFRKGNDIHLEDLNSKTGTFVNNKKICCVNLVPDDEILLGHTRIKFYRLAV